MRTRNLLIVLVLVVLVSSVSVSPAMACSKTCINGYDWAECWPNDAGNLDDNCEGFCTLVGWYFYCGCSGSHCEWV
jgi:hypothetical protein